jgi:hypothetical protein
LGKWADSKDARGLGPINFTKFVPADASFPSFHEVESFSEESVEDSPRVIDFKELLILLMTYHLHNSFCFEAYNQRTSRYKIWVS